jgi:hypothetical protein
MSNLITNIVIFHTKLGCDDESSTDEEQGEKILYYYPDETSLYKQISRINMLEGLIGFSSKFTNETIDVVILKDTTIVFSLVEKDIWIIITMNNSTSPSSLNRLHSNNDDLVSVSYNNLKNSDIYATSSTGLIESITRMYKTFLLLHGDLNEILFNNDINSNKSIKIHSVCDVRKKIRKLHKVSIYVSIYLCIYLCMYLSIYVSIYLCIYLINCLSNSN